MLNNTTSSNPISLRSRAFSCCGDCWVKSDCLLAKADRVSDHLPRTGAPPLSPSFGDRVGAAAQVFIHATRTASLICYPDRKRPELARELGSPGLQPRIREAK